MMRCYNINFARINRYMFDVKSAGRMKLESKITEIMETYLGGKLNIITVTKQIAEDMGIDMDELEGFAPITIQLEKSEVGIFIRERDNDFKCSFRSANDVNVSQICQTLGGGGHAKAAGCSMTGELSDIKKQLIEAVERAIG